MNLPELSSVNELHNCHLLLSVVIIQGTKLCLLNGEWVSCKHPKTDLHHAKKMCWQQLTEPFTSNLLNASHSWGCSDQGCPATNKPAPKLTWDWTDITSSKGSPRVQLNSSARLEKALKAFSHSPRTSPRLVGPLRVEQAGLYSSRA